MGIIRAYGVKVRINYQFNKLQLMWEGFDFDWVTVSVFWLGFDLWIRDYYGGLLLTNSKFSKHLGGLILVLRRSGFDFIFESRGFAFAKSFWFSSRWFRFYNYCELPNLPIAFRIIPRTKFPLFVIVLEILSAWIWKFF